MINKIKNIDWIKGMKSMPDNSIDCCVTSPPYWGLRDYGVTGQLGLEETPELYIEKLTVGFNEVRRVLKPNGTLWLNLADSYAASRGYQVADNKHKDLGNNMPSKIPDGLKAKDLVGIPWMAAFALRKAGWYLRQDIIWHKPNCMPESVLDRCTKNHEYLFLLSKNQKYYYDADAIKTPIKDSSISRYSQDIENQTGSNRVPGKTNGPMKAILPGRNTRKGVEVKGGNQGSEKGIPSMAIHGSTFKKGHSGNYTLSGELIGNGMANKRSVWTVSPMPFKEAHFATFPPELIVDCIKAGCPVGGTVLDPFMGVGTTAMVARKLDRNFIGFELNPAYIKIAEKRLQKELGMYL